MKFSALGLCSSCIVSSHEALRRFQTQRTLLVALGMCSNERGMEAVKSIVATDDFTSGQFRSGDKTKQIARFTGIKHVETSPLPLSLIPLKGESVATFFDSTLHRNLIFSSDITVKDMGQLSASQLTVAKCETEKNMKKGDSQTATDASVKEVKSSVLEIVNPINFPGLRIITTNTMAWQLCHVTESNHSDGTSNIARGRRSLLNRRGARVTYPEYRFILLDTKLKAEGTAPLVWLFNKLIGTKDSQDKSATKSLTEQDTQGKARGPSTTFSFTRIRPELVDDGSKVIFVANARLETRIELSSRLMQLLPVKLQTFEARGSATLQKALDKDIGPGMKRFEEAYKEWISR